MSTETSAHLYRPIQWTDIWNNSLFPDWPNNPVLLQPTDDSEILCIFKCSTAESSIGLLRSRKQKQSSGSTVQRAGLMQSVCSPPTTVSNVLLHWLAGWGCTVHVQNPLWKSAGFFFNREFVKQQLSSSSVRFCRSLHGRAMCLRERENVVPS